MPNETGRLPLIDMFVVFVMPNTQAAFLVRSTFVTQYCAGDKIEETEVDWACGAYE